MVGGRFNQRGLFIQQTADAGTLYTGVTGGSTLYFTLYSTLYLYYNTVQYIMIYVLYCTALKTRKLSSFI